jgi:camphor 5-monooxygenase
MMATTEPIHVPKERVVDFDVYNPPEKGSGYFRAWKDFQDRSPELVWTSRNGGHWIAMRGAAIRHIFSDPKRFSSSVILLPRERGAIHLPPTTLDPPVHRPFRALLNKGLSPVVVRGAEQYVRDYAVELLERIKPRGRCEFVHDFARFLPLQVFFRLANLPMTDRDMLELWMTQIIRPDGSMTQEEAMANFANYLKPHIEDRRLHPGEDLLSAVAGGSIDGRPITLEEAISMGSTLLIGGLDTVIAFMGFIMNYLAGAPDARAYIRQHRDKTNAVIDELFRRFPVGTNVRRVAEDIDFYGVGLKSDDLICMPQVLHSLDERVYERPMEVDFTRNAAGYVSFGHGVHRCPGSYLAKMEVAILLEEWLPRIPDFEVDSGAEITVSTGTTSGIFNLPLRWL